MVDECNICGGNGSDCSGCLDPYAINYDANANVSDGSCVYPVYGCMDPDALNYDSEANYSNGNCDYEPEVGFWFGEIDEDAGTMEIYFSNDDPDLTFVDFAISGAYITGYSGGAAEDWGLNITTSSTGFTAEGNFQSFGGLLTTLTYDSSQRNEEFCITSGEANSAGSNADITVGGCTRFIGLSGGELVNEDVEAGIDIAPNALSGNTNMSIGNLAEELNEEVASAIGLNGSGFSVAPPLSFLPYETEFEESTGGSRAGCDCLATMSSSGINFPENLRYDVAVCYLEDANDTTWEILEGSTCDLENCTVDVCTFGIFAPCITIEDCNGCLLYTSPSPRDGLLSRMPSSA